MTKSQKKGKKPHGRQCYLCRVSYGEWKEHEYGKKPQLKWTIDIKYYIYNEVYKD